MDASRFRIICPFINLAGLVQILEHNPNKIQVITRFSLAVFAECVSDITALRELLKVGANIRGIKSWAPAKTLILEQASPNNSAIIAEIILIRMSSSRFLRVPSLYAKIYLFGNSRAIVMSANLTKAALDRNHEFGLVAEDEPLIKTCRDYFDSLWKRAGKNLLPKQLDKWDKKVASHLHTRVQVSKAKGLSDFGVDVVIPISPIDRTNRAKFFKIPPAVANASQAFVKFFGTGENRIELSHPIIDMIKVQECPQFLAYPTSKYRPRQVQDGDVMFTSRMTKKPRVRLHKIGLKNRWIC